MPRRGPGIGRQLPEAQWTRSTRLLWARRPREMKLSTVAREAGVSRGWLSNFDRGVSPDPGINQVWALHQYLKERI